MVKTVFDVLKEKVERDKQSAIEFLAKAGAKDFSEYKELTGLIRGLETSLSHIEDLSRNYMEDEDE
tara:strand:- start:2008 stop:2205 length:198 start_codon:yes stop_codon:yes gene_type:complete